MRQWEAEYAHWQAMHFQIYGFVPNLPSEDTGILLVRFESGAIGEIVTSWAFSTVNAWHFEVSGELGAIAGGRAKLAHQHGLTPFAVDRHHADGTPVIFHQALVTHHVD